MYQVIKDIVIAVIFWTTLGTGSFIMLPQVYNGIRSMTQRQVSRGLSSTVKFTEALIGDKKREQK